MMLHVGTRFPLIRKAPYKFTNAEAENVVNSFHGEPTDARKALIDTLVGALKTAGVWTKLDALYLLAAHDAQAARRNWKNPGRFDLSIIGSPTFAIDDGYTGNGTDALLNPGFAPNTAGGNWTQNSAHVGLWIAAGNTEDAFDFGFSGTGDVLIQTRHTDTNLKTRLNDDTNTNGAVASPVGHTVISRTASNEYVRYKAGSALTTASVTSTALPGALRIMGITGSFSTKTFVAAHFGGGLTGTEVADAETALETYLTALAAI